MDEVFSINLKSHTRKQRDGSGTTGKDESPMTLPRASSAQHVSRSPVVLRREHVAHREAPIRPPAIRDLSHFVFAGKVVEAVRPLDRASEREVAREEDVRPVESHEQEPARGPRPDSGY